MIYDTEILDTIAIMQVAGAEPWQVLETLRPVGIEPDQFMPLWDDIALALCLARRRLRLRRTGIITLKVAA